ncbi:hypothetical protein MBLNU230_g6173t1 [Neophaeotheca triangularis]
MAGDRTTCRWAILSLSNIASVFVPDILLPRADSEKYVHEVVAVGTTRTAGEARKWLDANGVRDTSVQIYNDTERLLKEGDFDVLYISSPHPLHYSHVTKALEHGRNVLVEKPATMNAQQFAALIDLAQQRGVVLMEAMWTRYLPASRYFEKDLLPRIGEVKRVFSDFSFPIVGKDLSRDSRFLDKQAGAGALLDQGVYALHWIELALHGLAGDHGKTDVAYSNSISVPGVVGEVDDIDTIVLTHSRAGNEQQSGVAICSTSMTIPGSSQPAFYRRLEAKKLGPAVKIEGAKGSVAIPFPPIRPQKLHMLWYGEDHLDETGMEREEIVDRPVERGWGLWYQADVMASKVIARPQNAGGDVVGHLASMRVLRWMDEARRQAGITYESQLGKV